MAIPFCPNCGKILNVENEIGKCRCGYNQKIEKDFSNSEKIFKTEIGNGIIDEKNSAGFPHKCKKCGCEESEVVDLGAGVADEANIYLFKCKKCSNVERQADGSCNL